MSVLKVQHRRSKKYAIGDLRERITIHTRAITSPDFNSADNSETYDDGVETWAFVNTIDFANSGRMLFDQVNLSEQPSHKFVIRYRNDVTKENRIRWRGNAYKLLRTIIPEERNQYIEIFAVLLGTETVEANT